MAALVAADGTTAEAFAARLSGPATPMRDLADAVHSLCAVHGSHPGVIDHALARNVDRSADAWLSEAATGFAAERALLAALAAAVGPVPSTPGQAQSESALAGQRRAFDMLVQSDRTGCAIGASVALVLDWAAVRAILESAARRVELTTRPSRLPGFPATITLVETLTLGQSGERAMTFGAQQALAQHRGLWNLLEARASARRPD